MRTECDFLMKTNWPPCIKQHCTALHCTAHGGWKWTRLGPAQQRVHPGQARRPTSGSAQKNTNDIALDKFCIFHALKKSKDKHFTPTGKLDFLHSYYSYLTRLIDEKQWKFHTSSTYRVFARLRSMNSWCREIGEKVRVEFASKKHLKWHFITSKTEIMQKNSCFSRNNRILQLIVTF